MVREHTRVLSLPVPTKDLIVKQTAALDRTTRHIHGTARQIRQYYYQIYSGFATNDDPMLMVMAG